MLEYSLGRQRTFYLPTGARRQYMHNNLYYRIGSGWYQPLSQGRSRRSALLLYALLGAVVGPTGALALAAYAATPPPPS